MNALDHYEPKYWILDADHNLIPATLFGWAKFFETPGRIVAQDMINGVRVSTVFLGIDHGRGWLIGKDEPPVVFETMIFGGEHNDYQERCCTWDEAVAMHAKAVALVKGEPNGQVRT